MPGGVHHAGVELAIAELDTGLEPGVRPASQHQAGLVELRLELRLEGDLDGCLRRERRPQQVAVVVDEAIGRLVPEVRLAAGRDDEAVPVELRGRRLVEPLISSQSIVRIRSLLVPAS